MSKVRASRAFESARSIAAQGSLIIPKTEDEKKREEIESNRVTAWAMLDCDRFWRHYDSLDSMGKVRLETAVYVLWDQLRRAAP